MRAIQVLRTHFRGDGRLKLQFPAAIGVHERQSPRVQANPRKLAAAPIGVANDRVADMRTMYSQLVRPSCDRFQFEQRG